MKKFNKKTTAFFLALMMLLTFVPSLSFADEPAAPMMILRMDSDYYKKGDEVNAELWVYNANFNVAGFALKFDTESVKLADGDNFYNSVLFDQYYQGKGIFTPVGEETTVVDNEKGIVKAVFFVNMLASDAPAVPNPTNKNAREVQVGTDGYKLADIKLVAQKDGAAEISFTKIEKDADFDKRVYVLGYKGETPHDVATSVECKETPYADAEKFAEMVEKIGEVTLEDEIAITEAAEAYDDLSELAKELAKDAKAELDAAKTAFDKLNPSVGGDEEIINNFLSDLERLKNTDGDIAELEIGLKVMKEAYEALTDEQKAIVDEKVDVEEVFAQVQAKIDELKNDTFVVGDVDGNGKADTDDATQILRYVCGKPSVLDGVEKGSALFKAGDVDNSGTVDTDDATQILRYVCGKPSVITD